MTRIAAWLFRLLITHVALVRKPDFVVGADNLEGAYLHRWWVIPRNRFFNVYLHEFLRDDDDRALHDHPWHSLSLMLSGAYIEHTIAAGGIHRRERITAGSLRYRGPRHAHRIELEKFAAAGYRDADGRHRMLMHPKRCWTLFLTSPTVRDSGFHCPAGGWRHWREFTAAGKPGEVGRGCD